MVHYPYESQWGDLACNQPLIEQGANPATLFDWRSDGYPSEEEYLFWSHHVCGLACFRSVLRAWIPQRGQIPMYDLIERARQRAVLVREEHTVRGLYYQPFVDWVREDFGIEGTVHARIGCAQLLQYVRDGHVALASVSSEIRYPDRPNARRGGHLVLVHAVENGTIVLHNPSGVGRYAENARVESHTFERFFAQRGVTLRKPE